MDFECDIGYSRAVDSPVFVCINHKNKDFDYQTSTPNLLVARKRHLAEELKREQCRETGFYEISQGYRKIPGTMCEGGLDLAPKIH